MTNTAVPRGSLPRVLCVDDNHDTADSEVMLLQLAGFDARACYCGPSALVEADEFLRTFACST